MGLEALELAERAQPGVLIIESDHESHRDLIILQVVQERPSICIFIQGPSGGMHDQPWLVVGRIDFPKFLDAYTVSLWLRSFTQAKSFNDLFSQRAAAAFRQKCVFSVQLHTRLVSVGMIALFVQPHVTGGDALDRSVVIEQHLRGGEARKDLDLQSLGLFRQPATQVAQADDVVAGIVHGPGQKEHRYAAGPGLAQKHQLLAADRGIQRRTLVFPVRYQLVQGTWFQHCPGQNVGTDFGPFFDHANADFVVILLRKLFQPYRRGQAGWTSAYYNDIICHGFAFHRPPRVGCRSVKIISCSPPAKEFFKRQETTQRRSKYSRIKGEELS